MSELHITLSTGDVMPQPRPLLTLALSMCVGISEDKGLEFEEHPRLTELSQDAPTSAPGGSGLLYIKSGPISSECPDGTHAFLYYQQKELDSFPGEVKDYKES